MRIFAIILSLYFLIIGVMPCFCADEHGGEALCHEEIAEGHSDVVGGIDLCSLFCNDHSCTHAPVISYISALIDITPCAIDIKVAPCFYAAPFVRGVLGSIWRPPKA